MSFKSLNDDLNDFNYKVNFEKNKLINLYSNLLQTKPPIPKLTFQVSQIENEVVLDEINQNLFFNFVKQSRITDVEKYIIDNKVSVLKFSKGFLLFISKLINNKELVKAKKYLNYSAIEGVNNNEIIYLNKKLIKEYYSDLN